MRRLEPKSHFWPGPGGMVLRRWEAGKWGLEGRGVKISLVFLLRRPLRPPPLPTPTPAIDYIQFLHKEKKKQEEEVSTLRKDVMALKIMKV